MRILIDTNIFIYREEYRVVDEDLTELLQLLNEIKSELVVHPLSIEELRNDKDSSRRAVNLSKIQAYSTLTKPPDSSKDSKYRELIPIRENSHDKIDNEILYALYRDSVSYLITEDKGIHKKAQLIGVSDRVFFIGEALDHFNKYLPSKIATLTPPGLIEDYLHNIDLEDTFFDSLRADYDFNKWFKQKCREGRKCYVHKLSNGTLGAILIFKIEDEFIPTTPPLPKEKRLKISTLKVDRVGFKIGELLLKVAIDEALKNKIDEIYLTHFTEKEDRLVDLITEYGFYHAGEIIGKKNEDVYAKRLSSETDDISHLTPAEISRMYYPSICDSESVNKFIIPILPEFHDRLFTDYKSRQTHLSEYFGEFTIEGNTIKKAYLTGSNIKKIKSGDIIFFYRSRDTKAITSIGVVDAFHPEKSKLDEIMRIIGKRSVYTSEEIENMKKPLGIILFRHHFHLQKDVPLRIARELKILSGHPQSISQISEEQYITLKKNGGVDERFTIH